MSEPAVAAPIVLPPADIPPPQVAPKPFHERFAAMESKVGDDSDETPAAGSTPSPEAPKPDAKAPPDAKEAKRAQLKALAQELGLAVDETSVSVQDAVEVRAAKRRNLEWKAKEEEAFAKKQAEFDAQHGEKLKKSSAVLDAFERGDPESFAQALGVKDFNELQQSWIKRLADPNYMELRRLQKRAEEEDAKRETEAKTAQERAQLEERHKVKTGYMRSLSESCKASANPLVQAMHDDPLFLNAIYAIQDENWDPVEERTVTVEEAIKKAARGAKTDLETELRTLHERLGKGFASVGATAPPAAAKTNGNGKKPAPKTAVTPSNSGAAGGAPKAISEMTPKEWADYKKAKFAELDD